MFGAEINVYDMGISTINEWFKKRKEKKRLTKVGNMPKVILLAGKEITLKYTSI